MASTSKDGVSEPGAGRSFPTTRHSVLRRIGSDDPLVREEGYDALITAYWKPVYKYVRIRWHVEAEDARDVTQSFFTRAMEKDFFQTYDPSKARFRTFLRICLDAFVSNERRSAGRLKRGGRTVVLSLDFETADGELRHHEPSTDSDLDEFFYKEWVRNLFGLAVQALREKLENAGRGVCFGLFEHLDLSAGEAGQRPTYEELARRFDLSTTQVTNYLAAARREFRRITLEKLRELTGSEEEFRAEARALLGVDP
jgi:RNA polymerase sigma factor (sigma-70 family)